jgi:hypothetical protein
MTVYIELQGGLGNQLFIFSVCYLSIIEGNICIVDTHQISPLRDDLQVANVLIEKLKLTSGEISTYCHRSKHWFKRDQITRILKGRRRLVIYSENFSELIDLMKGFKGNKDFLLRGYWHFAPQPTEYVNFLRNIMSENAIACSKDQIIVHVRRGDYLAPQFVDHYNTLTVQYFVDAIALARTENPSLAAHFISDDPQYVRDYLVPIIPNSNVCEKTCNSFEFMAHHIYSDHYVLSNSTYSWWCATLSKATSVIAPSKWHQSHEPILISSEWRLV